MKLDEIVADEFRKAGLSEETIRLGKQQCDMLCPGRSKEKITGREEEEVREAVRFLLTVPPEVLEKILAKKLDVRNRKN